VNPHLSEALQQHKITFAGSSSIN